MSKTREVDVAILGAGTAGLSARRAVQKERATVLMIVIVLTQRPLLAWMRGRPLAGQTRRGLDECVDGLAHGFLTLQSRPDDAVLSEIQELEAVEEVQLLHL